MNVGMRPLRVALPVSMLLLAAGVPGHASISPEAAPVVRALEQHYSRVKTLQAVFLERYSDARQSQRLESGTVAFSRPGRMRWDYESPERKLFLADGKLVWFFVPADHTATRAPMKQSDDWRTPLALLTGKAKLPELCDRIEIAAGVHPGTPGNTVLSCLPRGARRAVRRLGPDVALADPTQPFDRVFLEVDPVTGSLADVRVLQPGGVELEYRFGNWKENLPLDESLFRFQPPPGVAIVNQPGASGR